MYPVNLKGRIQRLIIKSQRNKTVMNSIEVPEVCALAINNLPIVGRPIWRLTEGKHIVKLEITWQLPRSTTTRRTNQRSKTKRKLPADGVIQRQDGATKMADHSKMAAPTLPTTTDQLNVARCASPSTSMESREKTPPRPSTPSTAAVITTDQPLVVPLHEKLFHFMRNMTWMKWFPVPPRTGGVTI